MLVRLAVRAALSLVVLNPRAGGAQAGHADHGSGDAPPRFSIGAMAIGVATRAWPAALGRTVTEGYLTQPMVAATARGLGDHVRAVVTLNLEGLTLRRGEIDLGTYGEGYVDRRHPHTYVHELMLGASGSAGPVRGSLSAGKGFVPFGTDDPMMRPFVKYPANHHLSQIIERVQVVAAARTSTLALEAARFNGDEPESPGDLPNAGRALDSWATRLTVRPTPTLEISASGARVRSPEFAAGDGLGQKKENVAARMSRPAGRWSYALVEWSRTREHRADREYFRFTSILGESAWQLRGVSLAVRAERTERPEEDRLADPYRSIRPLLDLGILGKTRWDIVTVNGGAPMISAMTVRLMPFGEIAWSRPRALVKPTAIDPLEFFGADRLWMVSLGVRVHAGRMPGRMGRY